MDSTSNFVEYGTPLEPIEEDDVPSKKPVTVQDQIAVDDQGRRRFHGAFTGGFSAGYYNTVGSKEGWTPSEFKSSRQSRAESSASRKGQHAQDYMDEEDLGAFGIAPQILRATTDFEQREGRKRARPAPESSGVIPGIPVLEQIIQPVKETIGIRILQRMGWRPGQGVGPRLSKAERAAERKKRQEKKLVKVKSSSKHQEDAEPVIEVSKDPDVKVYGCFMPAELRKTQEDSDSDESIVDISQVTFAPDDFEDPLCNPKENTFGLGYSGLDRSALSFGSIDLFGAADAGIKTRVENRKLNIRGEAFGIGAFEDADEEVYNRSDMSQYDFSLETPEERKKRRGNERRAKSDKNSKTETGVVAGFVKAKNPPPLRKYFPPPPLPKNFEPKHYIRRSRFDQPPPVAAHEATKKKLGLDRHRLTIEERQVLLGEEKVPLTPQEQIELEEKAKADEEQAKRDLAIEKAERLKKFTEVLQTYTSTKAVPQAETGAGFKPFMKNPEKQERYEKYMTLVAAGFRECLKDLQPLEMTEWERERERMEFERASALYRPMGNVISSRFVSAQSHDISHLVPTKEVIEEKDPTQDPKAAAKMGLFGKLTHKVYEWHPDRLLSRRFNIPHPYPESKMVGVVRRDARSTVPATAAAVAGTATEPAMGDNRTVAKILPVPPVKKSLFDNIDFSKPPPGLLPLQANTTTSEDDICPPGTEQVAEEVKPPISEMESLKSAPEHSFVGVTKPPIDLFKEIFENSSSDSEDEDAKPPAPPPLQPTKPSRFESSNRKFSREIREHGEDDERESKRGDKRKSDNPDPPKAKGIFDNLDFSKLDAPRERASASFPHYAAGEIKSSEIGMKRNSREDERKKSESTNERMSDAEEENDVYGPPLPPRQPISVNSTMSKDIPRTKEFHTSSVLSKGSRVNPINSTLFSSTSSKERGIEAEEVVWVEVGKGNGREQDHQKSSNNNVKSKSKERKESNKTHKRKKKLKKADRGRRSSSSKKSKRRKELKSKKSKKKQHKRDSSTESSSGSEDETETDSEDSAIQIHQSVNNKALLSKLRELTRSK